MTSTTDTAGHPDVTEISDFAEGLLPPSRTADLRRHLDACDLCADVHSSLEEIRGLLGTLPGPPKMPDDVAQRIDAALAAEALLDARTAGYPEDEAAATPLRGPPQRRTTRMFHVKHRHPTVPPAVPAPPAPARAARSAPAGAGARSPS
ncbi:hypothetical protein GCM10020256_37830 [Streptomyces thermocoprophilus]